MGSLSDAFRYSGNNFNADIYLVEYLFNLMGRNIGALDGRFSQETIHSIQEYQTVHGQDATGVLNESDLNTIISDIDVTALNDSDPVVGYAGEIQRPYVHDAGVEAAQAMLAGYYTGTQDGLYGPLTRAAIVSFQEDHDLEATGYLTQKDMMVLAEAYAANNFEALGRLPSSTGTPERIIPDAVETKQPVLEAVPPSGRVVAYGDSLAVGFASTSGSIVNLGISGAGLHNGDASGLRTNLGKIQRGDTVIFSIGTNDLPDGGNIPAGYEQEIIERIRDIQSRGGNVVVVGTSSGEYANRNADWEASMNGEFRDLLHRVADVTGSAFVDTTDLTGAPYRAGDHLHYSGTGYQTVVDRAMEAFNAEFKAAPPTQDFPMPI